MNTGQLYCLGFIFDVRLEYGYFIKKIKPDWQKNKLKWNWWKSRTQ